MIIQVECSENTVMQKQQINLSQNLVRCRNRSKSISAINVKMRLTIEQVLKQEKGVLMPCGSKYCYAIFGYLILLQQSFANQDPKKMLPL